MAESIVQVTEGSGKKLHTFNRTIGANSVEDEVVIQGENYLASYMVQSGNPSTATANSHLLQICAGASLKVRVRRIECYQVTAVTTGVLLQFAIFRITTAGTGGTAVTPLALDPADAAAGATGIAIPGVKGTEAAASLWNGSAYMIQTVGASTAFSDPLFVIDFDRPRSKPLIIAAGTANGIVVKNLAAAAAGAVAINVWIDESNF